MTQKTRRRVLAAMCGVGVTAIAGCGALRQSGLTSETEQPTADEETEDEETEDEETEDEAEQTATLNNLVDAAETTAANIETWRAERIETIEDLATDDTVVTGTQSERQAYLESEIDADPADIYHIHLVDLDSSDIVASSDPAYEGQVLNTRVAPWQTDPIEYGDDDVFVSSATEALSRSLLSMVTPVEADDDRELVLVVQLDLDEYSTGLTVPETAQNIEVVDGQGRIVMGSQETGDLSRNDGSLRMYQGGEDAPALQRGLDGESGFEMDPETDRLDGDDVQRPPVAYAPVSEMEWVVVIHAQQTDDET